MELQTAAWHATIDRERAGELEPEQYLYINPADSALIAIAQIHQPQFYIYRDCIIQRKTSTSSVDDWFDQLSTPNDVEKIVNHLHVWDISNLNGIEAEFLGKWIAAGWSHSAKTQFPTRQIYTSCEEGEYGFEVTLWSRPGTTP